MANELTATPARIRFVVGMVRRTRAELVDGSHGQNRPDKSRQGHAQHAQGGIRPVGAHRQDGPQAGARGHPDQVGVRQRVTEQSLVRSPAACQGRSGHGDQGRARQAQVEQDG